MGSELPEYGSSSYESPGTRVDDKRAAKKTRHWTQEKIFDNDLDAQSFINSEGCWSTRYTNQSEQGKKVFYRCKLVKKKGPQCDASLQLHYDSASFRVFLLRAGKHTHNEVGANIRGIDNSTKQKLEEMFNNNIKPKEILFRLASTSSTVNLNQVKNFLSQLRPNKYGRPTISLGELEAFLLSNIAIPENPTTAFVVEYEVSYEANAEFRFFISSKKLLELAPKSTKIHADATYKLNWNGFPVLLVGTTDMDRNYHNYGVAVCTNETSEDFEFLFKSLRSGVQKIGGVEIRPKVLISDATSSIRDGFRRVFGSDNTIIMCWAHMRKDVFRKLEKLCAKDDRAEILADLDQFQLAKSPEIFDHVVGLFIKKWSSYPQFTKYFQDEWLNQNRNWYEGAALKSPSTNIALEATNKLIREENMFRERLPLNEFKEVLLNMVSRWSIQYELGLKTFNDKPTVSLSDWTAAFQWAKKNKPMKTKSTETHDLFFVMAGDESDHIDPFPMESWKEFSDYTQHNFKMWTIQFPIQEQNTSWIDGSCDCPKFLKNFMCKHVAGVALRLQYARAPPEAQNVLIGQKRKRGRPLKTKKGLIMQ